MSSCKSTVSQTTIKLSNKFINSELADVLNFHDNVSERHRIRYLCRLGRYMWMDFFLIFFNYLGLDVSSMDARLSRVVVRPAVYI